MDREAFLAGLDPSIAKPEHRPGIKLASQLGAMFAHVMIEQGYPQDKAALLYIFSDILQHIGNRGDD